MRTVFLTLIVVNVALFSATMIISSRTSHAPTELEHEGLSEALGTKAVTSIGPVICHHVRLLAELRLHVHDAHRAINLEPALAERMTSILRRRIRRWSKPKVLEDYLIACFALEVEADIGVAQLAIRTSRPDLVALAAASIGPKFYSAAFGLLASPPPRAGPPVGVVEILESRRCDDMSAVVLTILLRSPNNSNLKKSVWLARLLNALDRRTFLEMRPLGDWPAVRSVLLWGADDGDDVWLANARWSQLGESVSVAFFDRLRFGALMDTSTISELLSRGLCSHYYDVRLAAGRSFRRAITAGQLAPDSLTLYGDRFGQEMVRYACQGLIEEDDRLWTLRSAA